VRDVGGRLDKNDGKMTPGIALRALTRHFGLVRFQNATMSAVLRDRCDGRNMGVSLLCYRARPELTAPGITVRRERCGAAAA